MYSAQLLNVFQEECGVKDNDDPFSASPSTLSSLSFIDGESYLNKYSS